MSRPDRRTPRLADAAVTGVVKVTGPPPRIARVQTSPYPARWTLDLATFPPYAEVVLSELVRRTLRP